MGDALDRSRPAPDAPARPKHFPTFLRCPVEPDNPAVLRYSSECIMCGNCTVACTDYADVLGRYRLEDTGDRAVCIHCGQCVSECSSFGMQPVRDYDKVAAFIAGKAESGKVLVATVSPAVRVSIGEAFGLPEGSFEQGRLVALLRALGFDYVLDTNFAADLTVMEEAAELVARMAESPDGGGALPMFTSCCPSWVRYCELVHPDLIPNLSTAKSPIGMQGATIKTYFADRRGIDPAAIVNVAITPCTAKKHEIGLESYGSAGAHLGIEGVRDMDFVVTARELVDWTRAAGIDFAALGESGFDSIMGQASGAGVIFGASGGVMQAALREASRLVTAEPPAELLAELHPIRGFRGAACEATVELGGERFDVAVVYGTANATRLIEQMRAGERSYRFVEVMTCPGGCAGGGGQPKGYMARGFMVPEARMASLYGRDGQMELRMSCDNPEVRDAYAGFYGAPASELAEELLHTRYFDRSAEFSS